MANKSRKLGKFNIEPGKVPRPFDKQLIETFAFNDNQIKVSYIEITDYDPTQLKKPIIKSRHKLTNLASSLFDHTSNELDMEANFNLESEKVLAIQKTK